MDSLLCNTEKLLYIIACIVASDAPFPLFRQIFKFLTKINFSSAFYLSTFYLLWSNVSEARFALIKPVFGFTKIIFFLFKLFACFGHSFLICSIL